MAGNINQELTTQEKNLLASVMAKIKKLVDMNGFVKRNDTTVVIDKASYGTTPPEQLPNPVEGQIYFYIDEVK